MSVNDAITVEGLSKTYAIHKRPIDRLKSILFRSPPSDFYAALRDVSFTVSNGETVGIIGENGAGKSTLLKILSGVLTPSGGTARVDGLVLSILELGVGFHPEFTGRDNIFFYGDVLGFGRDFIREKTGEIIEFSELSQFIDAPIRTYSSGMVMRLAFSVVTSFMPEVLILDEVLSVGDIHFQKKSLNRILDFRRGGNTILFCSHDTYSVRMICDRTMWLRDGAIEALGETDRVVALYESYQLGKDLGRADSDHEGDDSAVVLTRVEVTSPISIKEGGRVVLEVDTETSSDAPYHIMVSLKLKEGRGVFLTGTHLKGGPGELSGGRKLRITFRDVPLFGLGYFFHVRVFDETGIILINERISRPFDVLPAHEDDKFLTKYICRLDNSWEVSGR